MVNVLKCMDRIEFRRKSKQKIYRIITMSLWLPLWICICYSNRMGWAENIIAYGFFSSLIRISSGLHNFIRLSICTLYINHANMASRNNSANYFRWLKWMKKIPTANKRQSKHAYTFQMSCHVNWVKRFSKTPECILICYERIPHECCYSTHNSCELRLTKSVKYTHQIILDSHDLYKSNGLFYIILIVYSL